MDSPLNMTEPLVMHIDLNSAFATTEQQANPNLRGKPVGVAANVSPGGCVISPSVEAKALGVKVGMRVRDAKEFCPGITIIPGDPDKYFYIHKRFREIFYSYSPDVVGLSIDEAVINFKGTEQLRAGRTLEEIGYEIKRRMHDEIGEWMRCNVGISTNRFLAKMAASLHKPDGLDIITHENLRETYVQLELMDLTGINTRNDARLRRNGIHTPLEFLDAPVWKLHKQVFQSVMGHHWYGRLRGFEVDDVQYGRKSYGQTYALHRFSNDMEDLSPLIMKLCEKMGRRLRRSGHYARGLKVWCGYRGQRPGWAIGRKLGGTLYGTVDIYHHALRLMEGRPMDAKVTHLGITCYDLQPVKYMTLPLFENELTRSFRVSDAMDKINNTYGEYVVYPARMIGLGGEIIKRVPFHATSDTLGEFEID